MGGGSSKPKTDLDSNQLNLLTNILTQAPKMGTNNNGRPADEYNYILENLYDPEHEKKIF